MNFVERSTEKRKVEMVLDTLLLVSGALVLVVLFLLFRRREYITRWQCVGIEPDPKREGDFLIHVRVDDLARTYSGNLTVWHNVETGERPGTKSETLLSQWLWRWKRESGIKE